jgi:hypothetical protein
VCNGGVQAKTIRVKMTIYKGADKSSGEDFDMYSNLAPLAGNQSSSLNFVDPVGRVKNYHLRYIRVEVDSDNTIKETIETNNWWETGAAPFPEPSNSCNPKSP